MLDRKKFQNLKRSTNREMQSLLALSDSKLFYNANSPQDSYTTPNRKYENLAGLRCVAVDGKVREIYVCKHSGKLIFNASLHSDNSWVAYNENPGAPVHFRAPFSEILEKLEILLARKTVLYSGGDATFLGRLTFEESITFLQIEGFIVEQFDLDFPDIYENLLYSRFSDPYTRELDPPFIILLYRAAMNRFLSNEESEEQSSSEESIADSSTTYEESDSESEPESDSGIIDLTSELQQSELLPELQPEQFSDDGFDDTCVQNLPDWEGDKPYPLEIASENENDKQLILHPLNTFNPQQSVHLLRKIIVNVLKAVFCAIYMASDYIAVSYVKKL